MDITKESFIEHIENLLDNIESGEPVESTVELTALGAKVKLNLSTLAYGAIVFLDGTTWFKEADDMWTASDGGEISQVQFARCIRAARPSDVVFLYNGEVYR